MFGRTRRHRTTRTGAICLAISTITALTLVAGCSAPSSNKSAPNSAAGKAGRPNAEAPAYDNSGQADSAGNPADTAAGNPAEVDPAEHPTSTFAMDVDTASYGYARRVLRDGHRPEASTVRPEEFVNAFRQDYPEPAGNGFTIRTDGAALPRSHRTTGDTRILRVGLRTRPDDPSRRPDAALTFVVDVSGSMGEPGKLDLVKSALHTLVEQLRPTDSVALVAYDDNARTLREMTSVRDRRALLEAIDGLRVGGSTNLEAGLVRGYEVARAGFRSGASNRVVLLSDGLANVGDTDATPILDRVREAAAKQISLLGVGVGSDYGDALMEQLADRGDGFVVYVSDVEQAKRIFVDRLPATLAVRALDAKVQVTFDPAVVSAYRLIGYDDRALRSSDFRNDRVDGGEVGPGHTVTALYTVRLRDRAAGRVAEARVRWLDPVHREPTETATTVTVEDLGRTLEAASPQLRVDYSAAYFAEVLRGSRYGDEVRLADLASIADHAATKADSGPTSAEPAAGDADVADLAALIRRAERI
jgi:Ca-activated chloride channel family protein